MVRRGSTVRVRQRASEKASKWPFCCHQAIRPAPDLPAACPQDLSPRLEPEHLLGLKRRIAHHRAPLYSRGLCGGRRCQRSTTRLCRPKSFDLERRNSGSRSPARAWTHARAVAAISQLTDVRSPRNGCIPQLARSGVRSRACSGRRTRRSCGLASKRSPRCVMRDSPFQVLGTVLPSAARRSRGRGRAGQ